MSDRITDGDNPTALAPDEAHVRVRGDARGAHPHGVGERLMSHCASVARTKGKSRLTLNTSEANTTAQRFYEAIGFVRLPEPGPRRWLDVCL